MNLLNLLSTQKQRDSEAERTASLFKNDRLTLLFAKQLGDILTAWRGIEYWEQSPAPRTREGVGASVWDVMECDIHSFRNPLLAACMTAFSTLLTLGYAIGTRVDQVASSDTKTDVTDSFFRMFFNLSHPIDDFVFQMVVADFLALCEALGFDEQTLVEAYVDKTYEWKEHGLGEGKPRLTQAEIDAIRAEHPLPVRDPELEWRP